MFIFYDGKENEKTFSNFIVNSRNCNIASANETLDCTNNTTNQCCIDVANIQNAISQSPTGEIETRDGKIIVAMDDEFLQNDGIDGTNCIDDAKEERGGAYFQWQPGNWVTTIRYYGPISSSNNPDARIITNN